MAENAALFMVYNRIQDLIRSMSSPGHSLFGSRLAPGETKLVAGKRELGMGELALAAGAAGAVTSFVL